MSSLVSLALILFLALGLPAQAGSLQVSTVSLDVVAPGAATTLILRNTGTEAISAQLRVFKWLQQNETEELIATEDVVASPPLAKLEPGQDYTVRIVRVARRPVEGEETYRLLVDELPQAQRAGGLGVKFALRYSQPVFFGSASRVSPKLAWSAHASKGTLKLTAINSGERRVRLSAMKITNSGGQQIVSRDGLFGYVLGGARMTWDFPLEKDKGISDNLHVAVSSDGGAINASFPVKK